MRFFLPLCVLLMMLANRGMGAEPLPRGHVLFSADFEAPDALREWGGGQLRPGHQGGQALYIERASPGTSAVNLRLPVERFRGCTVHGHAMVKAEDVSQRPQHYNGIKFMMPIESPAGTSWPQASVEVGSFDWKRISFSARVPADATSIRLNLGLEAVSGRVWFDDIRIVVAKAPPARLPAVAAGPAFRGHDLPRLRGAMISPRSIDEAGLRTLGQEWGANLVRWQLIRTGPSARITTEAEYEAWLESELARLDAMLPLCEKYGLYVVIDLHSPWGGRPTSGGYVGSDGGLFTSRAAQERFVEDWRRMAKRYRDAKVVWGYDLVNEPVEGMVADDCDDWHTLAQRTARAIREIDPVTAIIVEPADWGGPAALAGFWPIDVPNVIYSVHIYEPHRFTHQGVYDKDGPAYHYPGVIEGKVWNRAELARALAPVEEFQKKWNVSIYIGEFSAIRWAPDQSAYRYLKDLIELMEERGWDWSYHAFREWSGWSVEHTEDRVNTRPAPEPTQRQKLLMEWFGKNQQPGW
jgi:endoglucanase